MCSNPKKYYIKIYMSKSLQNVSSSNGKGCCSSKSLLNIDIGGLSSSTTTTSLPEFIIAINTSTTGGGGSGSTVGNFTSLTVSGGASIGGSIIINGTAIASSLVIGTITIGQPSTSADFTILSTTNLPIYPGIGDNIILNNSNTQNLLVNGATMDINTTELNILPPVLVLGYIGNPVVTPGITPYTSNAIITNIPIGSATGGLTDTFDRGLEFDYPYYDINNNIVKGMGFFGWVQGTPIAPPSIPPNTNPDDFTIDRFVFWRSSVPYSSGDVTEDTGSYQYDRINTTPINVNIDVLSTSIIQSDDIGANNGTLDTTLVSPTHSYIPNYNTLSVRGLPLKIIAGVGIQPLTGLSYIFQSSLNTLTVLGNNESHYIQSTSSINSVIDIHTFNSFGSSPNSGYFEVIDFNNPNNLFLMNSSTTKISNISQVYIETTNTINNNINIINGQSAISLATNGIKISNNTTNTIATPTFLDQTQYTNFIYLTNTSGILQTSIGNGSVFNTGNDVPNPISNQGYFDFQSVSSTINFELSNLLTPKLTGTFQNGSIYLRTINNIELLAGTTTPSGIFGQIGLYANNGINITNANTGNITLINSGTNGNLNVTINDNTIFQTGTTVTTSTPNNGYFDIQSISSTISAPTPLITGNQINGSIYLRAIENIELISGTTSSNGIIALNSQTSTQLAYLPSSYFIGDVIINAATTANTLNPRSRVLTNTSKIELNAPIVRISQGLQFRTDSTNPGPYDPGFIGTNDSYSTIWIDSVSGLDKLKKTVQGNLLTIGADSSRPFLLSDQQSSLPINGAIAYFLVNTPNEDHIISFSSTLIDPITGNLNMNNNAILNATNASNQVAANNLIVNIGPLITSPVQSILIDPTSILLNGGILWYNNILSEFQPIINSPNNPTTLSVINNNVLKWVSPGTIAWSSVTLQDAYSSSSPATIQTNSILGPIIIQDYEPFATSSSEIIFEITDSVSIPYFGVTKNAANDVGTYSNYYVSNGIWAIGTINNGYTYDLTTGNVYDTTLTLVPLLSNSTFISAELITFSSTVSTSATIVIPSSSSSIPGRKYYFSNFTQNGSITIGYGPYTSPTQIIILGDPSTILSNVQSFSPSAPISGSSETLNYYNFTLTYYGATIMNDGTNWNIISTFTTVTGQTTNSISFTLP